MGQGCALPGCRFASLTETPFSPDDPAVRGQIRAVRYLVEFEEVASAPAKKAAPKKKEEAEA